MIATQCPQCRKRYQLAQTAAGRKARCRCGASWWVAAEGMSDAPGAPQVAGDGPRDLTWEDEIADVFGEPHAVAAREARTSPPAAQSSRPCATAPQSAVSASAPEGEPAASSVPSGAAVDAEQLARRAARTRGRMPEALAGQRRLVAVLCMAYGALATLVLGGIAAWTFPAGMFSQAFEIAVAAGIVAGGVLLWRGDEHAHAWAGLACLGSCFFPVWNHVLRMIGLATAGEFFTLIWTTALIAVLFAVPGYVVYWALRYEQARQELEEESRL